MKTLSRVMYFNKEVMTIAGALGMILWLTTSALLYFVNREYCSPFLPTHQIKLIQLTRVETNCDPNLTDENDPAQFGSIPRTKYLSLLMLTGQGEPDGDMNGITEFICGITAVGSVAVFAVPASMLAWGFEAEADRFIKLRHKNKARGPRMPVNSGTMSELVGELHFDNEITCTSDSSDWCDLPTSCV